MRLGAATADVRAAGSQEKEDKMKWRRKKKNR